MHEDEMVAEIEVIEAAALLCHQGEHQEQDEEEIAVKED